MTDQPYVVHESEPPLEAWDDPVRGRVVWRTMLSGDRTPTSGMTLGVAEIEPGRSDERHPHRHSHAEVYYILNGEGVVLIDGVEHAVRPGTAVFIPGNAWHTASNTSAETMRLLYVFAADSFEDVRYEFPEEPPSCP